MVRALLTALVASSLFMTGCDRPQPTPSVQAKTEAKPVVEPAPPQAQTAPPQPTAPPPAPAPTAAPRDTPKPAPDTPIAKPTAAPAKADDAVKSLKVADTLVLPASQGDVQLPHLAHAQLFPCASCHGEATPGKIGLTKETAHALCRECHQAKGKGPTACTGCHKK